MGDPYLPNRAKSEEHGTPPEIFNPLNDEFKFVLDAAATPENSLCKNYYTKEQDGTKQPWYIFGGSVWVNPPHNATDLSAFTHKALNEALYGVTTVMLMPAKTDQEWFHTLWREVGWDVELRWLRGRVKYLGNKHSAPFPSVIVIIRGKK